MARFVLAGIGLALVVVLAGCGGGPSPAGLPAAKDARLVAFGHSYVAGRIPDKQLTPWPQQVGAVLRVAVANRGLAGTTSDQIAPFVKAYTPSLQDTVTIEAAINDVGSRGAAGLPRFRAQLRAMLDHLVRDQRRPRQVLLLGDPPVVAWKVYPAPDAGDAVLERYNAAMRQLAEEYGVSYVDLGRGWDKGTDVSEVDGLHPTAAGTRRIRDVVARAIRAGGGP